MNASRVICIGLLALAAVAPGTNAQLNNVFTRGNVNDDFKVNGSDVDYLIAYFYSGGPPPLCMDAGDVNDDGTVTTADYEYLRDYLTGIVARPPAPFPNRGWDPTFDVLGCNYPTPAFPMWSGLPNDNITVCVSPGSQ